MFFDKCSLGWEWSCSSSFFRIRLMENGRVEENVVYDRYEFKERENTGEVKLERQRELIF